MKLDNQLLVDLIYVIQLAEERGVHRHDMLATVAYVTGQVISCVPKEIEGRPMSDVLSEYIQVGNDMIMKHHFNAKIN